MRKYGGKVTFATRDEHGLIEVVEDGVERSLHFGTAPKQSSMALHDPLRLQLSYTRAMLAPLLFQSTEPHRVLIVGLGGGSLAKFFLQHFPTCRVDAVELRAAVAQVAHEHFHLPDTPRLHISLDDAASFMFGAANRFSQYQLILIDAFAPEGIAHSVCGLSFFEACRARLAEDGMLSVNLWSRDMVDLEDMLENVGDAMDQPVLRIPVPGKDNIIALSGSPLTGRTRRPLSDRARTLAARYDIEFPELLKSLRKHNTLSF
jgi:spermidine synthase